MDDAWLDKRLGCLTEGADVIDISAGATGILSEYSFVVRQRVYDAGFQNVLAAGTNSGRYFSRVLCVRNAPSSLADSAKRISLATDLVVAVRAAGQLPPGYMIFMDLVSSGNGEPGWVEERCDPATHPIIIDYATGKLVTLTATSIGAVQIFDH